MKGEIVHTPFDLGLGFSLGLKSDVRVAHCCMMEWRSERLNLFWEIHGAEKPILLIRFYPALVARALDEMWHSVETNSDRWRGIDGSFARLIEGSEYPTQPDTLNLIHPDAKHYAFVTGGDCVDVIALNPPHAMLIEADEIEHYRLQFPFAD